MVKYYSDQKKKKSGHFKKCGKIGEKLALPVKLYFNIKLLLIEHANQVNSFITATHIPTQPNHYIKFI